MILTAPARGIVACSADPAWLDSLIDALEGDGPRPGASPATDGGDAPSRRVTDRERRSLRRDILAAGYVGPDGRVCLIFSDEAWRAFESTLAQLPRAARTGTRRCRHFCELAGERA